VPFRTLGGSAAAIPCHAALTLEESIVGGEVLGRLFGQVGLLAVGQRDAQAPATFEAMSDWTWNTSVIDASNGCCHFDAGAPDPETSTARA
jgi:hypothetical protein